jgi:hypothetical protein
MLLGFGSHKKTDKITTKHAGCVASSCFRRPTWRGRAAGQGTV